MECKWVNTQKALIVSTGFLITAASFLLFPAKTHAAASLYVSPAGGSFTIGSTFTVSIFLDTGGQPVNAVEADLSFPPDKLQVVSPSTGKSFVKTWIVQPTYSNANGTLKFQGIIPNPGIITNSGLVSTITFRVKDISTAGIKFLDTSRVLLNDGKATDILDKTSGSIYYLTLPPPEGPIVTSRTDPDQGAWYASPTVTFEWTAPPDIQGYSYVLDDNPNTVPDDISKGTGTRVVYNNLADGTHYFHLKGSRQNAWGGVTDYAVNIDKTPPAAFDIDISPSSYTSQRNVVVSFQTTDGFSGIDHYELAMIPLVKTTPGKNDAPFFIEASSPHLNTFDLGRYQIVVRAYDKAGNYYQSQAALTVVNPVFEIIGAQGVRLGGTYLLGWPYAGALALVLLVLLFLIARWIWKLHAKIEEQVRHGGAKHPAVLEKLQELKEKQKEYGSSDEMKTLIVIGLLFLAGIFLMGGERAFAADTQNIAGPEPPIITLFPSSISNDEILYIGGQANVPNAQILIYLEETNTKATVEKTVLTDKNGNWFYSFGDFLNSGRYIAWTQLKVGEVLSPPSSQIAISVAPTAFQIGTHRLDAQDFYLILTIVFLALFLILLVIIVYYGSRVRQKNRRLREEIKKAEESIRRGFSVLRRDIEDQLATIHKAKLGKNLTEEEMVREEKLLKDLEEIINYVGKEIWEIEKTEGIV